MINLEEEARKRRERLKSALSGTNSTTEATANEVLETRKRTGKDETATTAVDTEDLVDEFKVPEGEVLLDSTGAEILSLDSKLPDTLEAQVKSFLSPQASNLYENEEDGLTEPKDRNSDLKREYERRMTALNKKTRRAVVDIVRDRLEREQKDNVNE